MKQNKIPRNEYIIKPKGKTNPYKDDVVYTNLGQWKYPGQVTKIPSNQITMQGVDYPVQGIDDTGYSQMMYPGMDYTFPGEYVTEYPMQFPFGGIHTKTDTHMATGGWLDSYEPGGEKPWGDMSAKERAAYLDAKEANAKAETASRKQATKEHYQDYVKDSMKKTLEHPMFNAAQYFTPEGMAIGAIKGLANVGPDVAKGDYSAAAFDALTALPAVTPAVTPAVKNAYKINPWAFKSNPEAYYRGIGKTGLDDAIKNRTIRPHNKGTYDKLYFTDDLKHTNIYAADSPKYKGDPFNQTGDDAWELIPGDYKKYIAEIPKKNIPLAKSVTKGTRNGLPAEGPYYTSEEFPSINNVKFYKEHWLKGYKEVPVELPGSPNGFSTNDLKYEINNATDYFKALGKGSLAELKQIPKTVKYVIDNYSELKKLPAQYKNAVKEMTTPEGISRLKNLGVDNPDDFLKYLNDVTIAGSNRESNVFYPIGKGLMNINPEELKMYRSTKAPLVVPETAIDHELGHAIQHYLTKKGKVYPNLKNPYNAPSDIDIEAVEKLLPHTTNKVSTFFKEQALQKSPEELANMFKGNKHDLRSAEYFFNSESGKEPLAHLRELKRNLKNEGVINDIQETITPEHLKAFIDKTGNKDRVMSFMQNTPEAHKTLSTLLNKIPAVVPIGLGAAALQEEEDGGWLDNEFRRGGQKGLKHYTSKNIQSSVNDIMLRNETLFGPAGKRRFKPSSKYKDGGWLDNMY
jgi:hypothetical protein